MFLFLVAAGLSLIFGVLRVLNFAHGTFYMLGAYATYQLVQWMGVSGGRFWLTALGGALVVAALGGLIERFLFRDRKSTRLNSSHVSTSYAVFCLKKKSKIIILATLLYPCEDDRE